MRNRRGIGFSDTGSTGKNLPLKIVEAVTYSVVDVVVCRAFRKCCMIFLSMALGGSRRNVSNDERQQQVGNRLKSLLIYLHISCTTLIQTTSISLIGHIIVNLNVCMYVV